MTSWAWGKERGLGEALSGVFFEKKGEETSSPVTVGHAKGMPDAQLKERKGLLGESRAARRDYAVDRFRPRKKGRPPLPLSQNKEDFAVPLRGKEDYVAPEMRKEDVWGGRSDNWSR